MARGASWIASLMKRLAGRVIDFIYLGGGRPKKLTVYTDIIISTDSQQR